MSKHDTPARRLRHRHGRPDHLPPSRRPGRTPAAAPGAASQEGPARDDQPPPRAGARPGRRHVARRAGTAPGPRGRPLGLLPAAGTRSRTTAAAPRACGTCAPSSTDTSATGPRRSPSGSRTSRRTASSPCGHGCAPPTPRPAPSTSPTAPSRSRPACTAPGSTRTPPCGCACAAATPYGSLRAPDRRGRQGLLLHRRPEGPDGRRWGAGRFWDAFVRPTADARPIRIGRLLDDVADRKHVYVYPAMTTDGTAARPYYTVDNDLAIEMT